MKKINRIEKILKILNDGLYEREEIVSISLLSALASQNIFLYGPPGTAKSLISRRLSKAFETNQYFEHLMNRFSTPEEVFGPISIAELKKDNYIRKTEGFMPTADFVFLDEIWKSSPAILNTLLTIINEKKFKNGSVIENAPLKVLISASNETPPDNQGLDALYDRFLTRILVPPTSKRKNFDSILRRGKTTEDIIIDKNLVIKNNELENWKSEINDIKLTDITLDVVANIRRALENFNQDTADVIYVSDRRWQRAATLMKASAFFCDRTETNVIDCLFLPYCLWTKPQNRKKLEDIIENEIKNFSLINKDILHELNRKKTELDQSIINNMCYLKHLYKIEEILEDEKGLQIEKTLKIIDGEEIKEEKVNFFITEDLIGSQSFFYPLDENNNKILWIRCNFNEAGNIIVKPSLTAKLYGGHTSDQKFNDPKVCIAQCVEPKLLEKKGDRRKDIDPELVKDYESKLKKIDKEYQKASKKVEAYSKEINRNINNPFLTQDKIQIVLDNIQAQIEELSVAQKDCQRLLRLVNHI